MFLITLGMNLVSSFRSKVSSSGMMPEDDCKQSNEAPEPTEPSVFLDKAVLEPSYLHLQSKPKGRPYSINNSTYYESDCLSDIANLVMFEVTAERYTNVSGKFFPIGDDDDEDLVASYTSEDEENPSNFAELKIKIQQVPNGVIVNSDVFLTNGQWNTLMFVSSDLMKCVACDMYIDTHYSTVHIQKDSHKSTLDRYRPLATFDLSVTRKIRDQYHCGVCNEVFDLEDEEEHFVSKFHEENLNSAINKVSDLDISLGNTNKDKNRNNDSYHFNASAINYARNNHSVRNITNNNHTNSFNDHYYNTNRFNDCLSSVSENLSDSVEFDNDCDEVNESLWGEINQNAHNEFSYAAVTKKAKINDLPKYLVKDLGDKRVKVKFDSYHMLIEPKVNRFYCMVCKDYGHIRDKSNHCKDPVHLEKLNLCQIVNSFGDYFIRAVDDKLFHCGHCNKLVLVSEMDEHLEDKHQKKKLECAAKYSTENSFNDNLQKSSSNDIESKSCAKITTDGNSTSMVENNNNGAILNHHLVHNGPKSISDMVFINPFGYKLAIPMLAFNVILKRPYFTDFYCGLCDAIIVEENVLPHVNYGQHVQLLVNTGFVLQFGNNLIRAIREKFHCAICNFPIPFHLINMHIQEPMHYKLLTAALVYNFSPFNIQSNNVLNNLQQTVQYPVQPRPVSSANENNDVKETKVTETKITRKEKTLSKNTSLKIEKDVIETQVTKEKQLTKNIFNKDDEMDLMLNDSIELEFDMEDFLYVKVKNLYFKISLTSYNALVQIGNGSRFCFLCWSTVKPGDLKKHVDSQFHNSKVKDGKFLDKFENSLLRQSSRIYHCGVCNVLISRKNLKKHMSWPTHVQFTTDSRAVSKKSRKNDLKSGKAVVVASFVKEELKTEGIELKCKIISKVRFVNMPETLLEKKNKIVILGGDVLKIDFHNWHGICDSKVGYKCQLCEKEFCEEELARHVRGEEHAKCLEKKFDKEYLVHLLRQINSNNLHCMVCNTELANKHDVILGHVKGKRHLTSFDNLRASSSQTNAYNDCEEEPVLL